MYFLLRQVQQQDILSYDALLISSILREIQHIESFHVAHNGPDVNGLKRYSENFQNGWHLYIPLLRSKEDVPIHSYSLVPLQTVLQKHVQHIRDERFYPSNG